jgi:hypothetical protein
MLSATRLAAASGRPTAVRAIRVRKDLRSVTFLSFAG